MLHIPLACLMYQRGFHVLHGSAINYKNKTYLFIGRSGVGKSYIASEIIKLGGKLISEDICVIDFVNDIPYVLSSYPLIKSNFLKQEQQIIQIDSGSYDYKKRPTFKVGKKYFKNKKYKIHECYFLDWGKNDIYKVNKIDELLGLFMKYSIPPPQQGVAEGNDDIFLNISKLINDIKAFKYTRNVASGNDDILKKL